jgi:hypothetical protein
MTYADCSPLDLSALLVGYSIILIGLIKILFSFYKYLFESLVNSVLKHFKYTSIILEYFYNREDYKEYKSNKK